jgi:hypothetical protein
MNERDIGAEILEGLREIKAFKQGMTQLRTAALDVDNAEMDEILQDKELVRNLKKGLKELKNGEYRLV